MADVFISYSRKNSDFARRLIDKLVLSGKDSWVDWEGIPLTSPNWWAEIKAGIEGSDSFLFIMSPDSMASVVCNMELDYAIELGKRIVPVMYQPIESRDAFASIADFTPDEAMEERLAGKDALLIARDNWQRLSHINWAFFRDQDDFDAAFVRLITTVETDLEYVKAHTRYLIRAQEWERENRREDLLLFGGEIDRAEIWLKKAESYAASAEAGKKVDVVNPLLQTIQREHITSSRQADRRRRRQVRSAQLSIIILVFVLFSGSILVARTQQEAAAGQATLNSVNLQLFVIEASVTQAAIDKEIVYVFANAMLQQSDNPIARLAAMDELVRSYPRESLSWQSRGLLRAEIGNLEGAIADYDEALRLDPNNATVYNARGNARREQGDLQNALADYDEALRLNPDDGIVYNNLGNTKYDQGDLEGAIADYTEALRLNPDYTDAYSNRGLAKLTLGDEEGAIADYTEALHLNPEYTDAYINRGIAKANLGDLEGAIEDYDEALRLNPNYALVYYNRGNAKSDQGDLEGAIEDYSEAIRLNPDYASVYNNRGNAKYDQGNLEGAIADYDAAIRLNPEDASAYNNRGNAKYDQGDLQGAIADYSEAIRINPNFANAYWGLGNVYYDLEQFDESLTNYRRYLELAGDNPATFVVQRVTELEAQLEAPLTPTSRP